MCIRDRYLALEDGPPIFSQDNTCPDLLIASLVPQKRFRVRGYHPVSPDFPDCSTNNSAITCRLFPVRSPLLRAVSYTHLRAHETVLDLVCRLLLEKKKKKKKYKKR
eukprot:TRINITY_DN83_c0_g1_i12.p1 TRINITY_DN83_c0_g1~~TRINITY_DN83_c0_g1_i12.p1  ORF type:complete len:107 (-),score=26.13 TRINITY_DN83_c0_g1_i12:89-409(-)